MSIKDICFKDIIGEPLEVDDYVLFSFSWSKGKLYVGQIAKITNKSVIIDSVVSAVSRRICSYPQTDLLKITKEQYDKICQ